MQGTGKWIMAVVVCAALAGVSGCANTQGPEAQLQEELAQRNEKIRELESSLKQQERTVSEQQSEISNLSKSLERANMPDVASRSPSALSGEELLPPGAKAGECYARVFVPARYETETERLLKSEASTKLEVVPAQYEWVEERVLVKEASERLETVPAVYETVTERVIDRPAHTVWKKGRGPIERVDHATGEIMCLVEIPATYKSVSRRMVKTPATTRTVQIPAQYKTVKVRKLVSSPATREIEIPAQYQTITKRKLIADGRMEWRPILCETNASRPMVRDIQRALDRAGHSPGPIDGIIGPQTASAVRSFQKAKGLPTGGLTVATLDALGIKAAE
jgi:hypothetical protein